MLTMNNVRRVSTLLGLAGAGFTLYHAVVLGLTADVGPRTQALRHFPTLISILLPFVIAAAAIAVSVRRETAVSAGLMVCGFALQRGMIQLELKHTAPMVLIGLAVALALYVDAQLRTEADAAGRAAEAGRVVRH
jgi:hypothetical protein